MAPDLQDLELCSLKLTLTRRSRSRSAHYRDIRRGLFPRGVKTGQRAVAWPAAEIDALNRARCAGWAEREIKDLVLWLLDRRVQSINRDVLKPAGGAK